jgi:hypothetical protein
VLGWTCSFYEVGNKHKIQADNALGNIAAGRLRRKWEPNIEMGLG